MDVRVSLTEPIPFGHGISRLPTADVSEEEFNFLFNLVSDHWGINCSSIKVIKRDQVFSSVFYVNSLENRYVLNKSLINSLENQKINDECEQFAIKSGLPIPKKIKTSDQNMYTIIDGYIWTLSEKDEGKHYSGALDELIHSAESLALFHLKMKDFPSVERLKEIKGEGYSFSWQTQSEIVNILKERDFEEKELTLNLLKRVEELKYLDKDQNTNLPKVIGHYDWHPHNLIFNSNGILTSILDFDLVRFGYRAEDVFVAAHKNSRVFGKHTECKLDCDNDISSRFKFFIESYSKINKLTIDEKKCIKYFLYNTVRRKVQYILLRYVKENNTLVLKDLLKQFIQLEEIDFL